MAERTTGISYLLTPETLTSNADSTALSIWVLQVSKVYSWKALECFSVCGLSPLVAAFWGVDPLSVNLGEGSAVLFISLGLDGVLQDEPMCP